MERAAAQARRLPSLRASLQLDSIYLVLAEFPPVGQLVVYIPLLLQCPHRERFARRFACPQSHAVTLFARGPSLFHIEVLPAIARRLKAVDRQRPHAIWWRDPVAAARREIAKLCFHGVPTAHLCSLALSPYRDRTQCHRQRAGRCCHVDEAWRHAAWTTLSVAAPLLASHGALCASHAIEQS